MKSNKLAAVGLGVALLLAVLLGALTIQSNNKQIITIPVPPEHASQLNAAASDKYVVWEFWTGDIFGYDLAANKEIMVSQYEPFPQEYVDISGSTVVYESRSDERYERPVEIVVKDLDTGITSTIQTGVGGNTYPQIHGRKVAWVENVRLMLKDLDGGDVKQVASVLPDNGVSIGDKAISDEYVVWSEVAYINPREYKPRPSYLKSYNFKTGETRTVLQFEAPGGTAPVYSLDGSRLIIYEPLKQSSPRIVSLDTGEVTTIPWEHNLGLAFVAPILKDEVAVWAAFDSDSQGMNIWGLNLKSSKPMPLLIGEWDQIPAAIIGDRLVWMNRSEAGKGGIVITSLDSLFAAAPANLRTLQEPTPLP